MIIEDLTTENLERIFWALAKLPNSQKNTQLKNKIQAQWIEQEHGHRPGTFHKPTTTPTIERGYKKSEVDRIKRDLEWMSTELHTYMYDNLGKRDSEAQGVLEFIEEIGKDLVEYRKYLISYIRQLEERIAELEDKKTPIKDRIAELESQINNQ